MRKRYRPEHQRMLNDKRWAATKAVVWARARGCCEECAKIITSTGRPIMEPGVECHHVRPFESGRTLQEAEALCYDVNNVVLLCVRHHHEAHSNIGSHTKTIVKARRDERQVRRQQDIEAKLARLRGTAAKDKK